MFREIRKIVVNKIIVGNADILRTSWVNIALNRITKAIAILRASRKSNKKGLMGMIKNMIAANIYSPTAISFLFMPSLPCLSGYITHL
jgi:hypothetical protein